MLGCATKSQFLDTCRIYIQAIRWWLKKGGALLHPNKKCLFSISCLSLHTVCRTGRRQLAYCQPDRTTIERCLPGRSSSVWRFSVSFVGGPGWTDPCLTSCVSPEDVLEELSARLYLISSLAEPSRSHQISTYRTNLSNDYAHPSVAYGGIDFNGRSWPPFFTRLMSIRRTKQEISRKTCERLGNMFNMTLTVGLLWSDIRWIAYQTMSKSGMLG